jgi:TetR/AcrR family transcriptional regulator, repressor for neighboring sulfatase
VSTGNAFRDAKNVNTVPVARPRGRDEIAAAVIDAATRLFAERGPAAVSLRDVAAAAHVTLSQIYRHIGNKQALLAAVLAAEVGSDPSEPDAADIDLPAFLKALFGLGELQIRTQLQARTILDGFDLPALQSRYPGIELGIELLGRALPPDQARVRAAMLVSFVAGWQLLGPSYLRVTGAQDVTPERFAEIAAPLLDALAAAPPAAT